EDHCIHPDRSLLAARLAVVELERPDVCGPIEAARRDVVLLCEPERAVVFGIDRHAAVVAPALERFELHAAADRQAQWTEHGATRIRRFPPGHVDAGEVGLAHRVETDRDVARAIHGDASQPEIRVRIDDRSLLKDRRRAAGLADLIPAYAAAR